MNDIPLNVWTLASFLRDDSSIARSSDSEQRLMTHFTRESPKNSLIQHIAILYPLTTHLISTRDATKFLMRMTVSSLLHRYIFESLSVSVNSINYRLVVVLMYSCTLLSIIAYRERYSLKDETFLDMGLVTKPTRNW